MSIEIIPILEDNYAYYIERGDARAIIDPGEAQPILEWLRASNKTLTHIINTHHHWDHTDGNEALREAYNAKLAAPESERARIRGIDIGLQEDRIFEFGEITAQILETPGHTKGHICLYFSEGLADTGALFCADTVFSMGCGRLFEGTPEDMWQSFQKILDLPDVTLLYPGHEYTLANGRFCQSVEPDNKAIQSRIEEVRNLRASGKPSIPVSLKTEKETNVFLRARNAEEFAALRQKKDNF